VQNWGIRKACTGRHCLLINQKIMIREKRNEIIVHRGHIQQPSSSKISHACTPVISQKYKNFLTPSSFVIISTICSCVAICQLEIIPWSSWSQTCLNLMSMCFMWLLICLDLMRSRAPWLSIRSEVGLSQTSFGHIPINSLTILMVLMAMESPWKDLLIDVSHTSR